MEELTHEHRSSITITRSSTNGKYGWVLKQYPDSPLPTLWELITLDLELRRLFTTDETENLAMQLAASIAWAKERREEAE